MKIPVFLPVTREFGFRDEFAQDCLLQRGVTCEPRRPGARSAGARATGWHAQPAPLPRVPKSRAQSMATPRRTFYFAGSPWQWAGTGDRLSN